MTLDEIRAVKFDFNIGTLKVFVKNDNSVRVIELKYHNEKEPLVPAADWFSQVIGEVNYQKQQEFLIQSGRFLPFY